jgi:broad specificity phosphatase PhoE
VEKYFSLVGHDRFNIVPPGGESLSQFQHRVNAFLDAISMEDYKNILIIGHEETLRIAKARFHNLGRQAMEALSFDNCEYLVHRQYRQLKNTA